MVRGTPGQETSEVRNNQGSRSDLAEKIFRDPHCRVGNVHAYSHPVKAWIIDSTVMIVETAPLPWFGQHLVIDPLQVLPD